MMKWGKAPSEFYALEEYDRRKMLEYAYHFKKTLEDTITQSKRMVKKKGDVFGKSKPDPNVVRMVLPHLLEMQ